MANNSDLITWSDKFECGISLIDDQHKNIVALINDMFNHVTEDAAQEHEYFNIIIQETVKYIKIHFATEEKIMLVTKFEGCLDHKKEHENFIIEVLDNIHYYNVGRRFTLSTFAGFLKDWLLSHIRLVDKQYYEHLNSLAGKKSNFSPENKISDIIAKCP